jgi:acyl-CoA hydrolase
MRIVSAAEAVDGIGSGQQLWVHGGAATPSVLLEALVARAPELRQVSVVHFHTEGPGPLLARGLERSFRHKALFIGSNAREAVNEGRADYVPVFLSDVPGLFSSGIIPLDVALLNLSRPDAHGFCSLGTSVDASLAAARSAKVIVAQLNASMPRTHGDTFIHVSQIDRAVEVDIPPYAYPEEPVGEVERRIGEHIAALIPDGATLQLGIGAIPEATARALHDKQDLGIHTEMFTDPVMHLVESGAVTGRRKEINCGKVVSAFLMGTQRLYDWVDDNPMIELRPVDYTNDTSVIRRFRRMVAINSAIQVDVTGQVVADSIGKRFYSGVGGQMDFIRGAALAPEGRAIIALPSTAARGSISRIVPFLDQGAGVVTTRAHVQTIVTEYGVAELHGRSIRERAESLIAIAHPDFRDELRDAAHEVHRL